MSDSNNQRPISNLSFPPRTVERLVDARFTAYTGNSSLLPLHQPAYHTEHSTKTALVHFYSNMVATVDLGEVGAFVLLDMSAAFDTIDHRKTLDVLKERLDIQDVAIDWFASYFGDRTLAVVTGDDLSLVSKLLIGAKKSVLEPQSFITSANSLIFILLKFY
jgi:Reverse transcriptase (RNA-dependent DNA polymerase)